MLFRQMRIRMTQRVRRTFIARVKANFPCEALGYMIGRTDENYTLQVEEIFFPHDLDAACTPSQVNVKHSWLRHARRRARQLKAIVLGDIHSHPYTQEELARYKISPDCSPSEGDLARSSLGLVAGICLVKQGVDGKLRTRIKFWGPMVPVSEVVGKAPSC